MKKKFAERLKKFKDQLFSKHRQVPVSQDDSLPQNEEEASFSFASSPPSLYHRLFAPLKFWPLTLKNQGDQSASMNSGRAFNLHSVKKFFNQLRPSSSPSNSNGFKKRGGHDKFNVEKVARLIFAVESREKIHKGFLVTLLVSATFTLGKILALLLTGPELPDRGRPLYFPIAPPTELANQLNQLKTKNIFKTADPDAAGKGSAKTVDKNIICNKSQTPSNLPITLHNTIVLQDSVKSLASVQIRGQQEILNLREGEKIQSLAEIGKIDRLNVIIKNLQTGECEKLTNNVLEERGRPNINVVGPREGSRLMQAGRMEGISQDGNNISISRKLMTEKLNDMENILTQARAIQVQNPDGSMAFKVVEIVPGSIFSYLGIQDGDNITRINGKKIMGLNDVMNLFANIQNIDNLQMTIVKDDGTEQNMEYNFGK